MLAQANESLASRGIGRSSLSGGVQSTLRGSYVKELARQRLALIQKLTADRWAKILNLIAAAQGQAGQATSAANTSLNAATTASNIGQQNYENQANQYLALGKMLAGMGDSGGVTNNYYTNPDDYYQGDVIDSTYA
jgi:hypothetical protein